MQTIDEADLRRYLDKTIFFMAYFLRVDQGITEFYFFGSHLRQKKISLLEVNALTSDDLVTTEPMEIYGLDDEGEDRTEYSISIITLSENMWTEVLNGHEFLPHGWELKDRISYQDLISDPVSVSKRISELA
jgi:hypothetical protein